MKNTVTMAELMKKVTAYGQPQNLDEGFASDAQRRAAFASGYKEKGKKDKKEETLGEIKLSPPMIAKIKKTFEPLRDKKIGPGTQNKLMQTMDKIDKDKQTLVDLMNADIPFVSQLAVSRLISKHNMKADQINKLKEEVELDEGETLVEKQTYKSIIQGLEKDKKEISKKSKAFGQNDTKFVDKAINFLKMLEKEGIPAGQISQVDFVTNRVPKFFVGNPQKSPSFSNFTPNDVKKAVAHAKKMGIMEEVELDELKMNDPKLIKVFDKIKPRDTIQLKVSSGISKDKGLQPYTVRSKNTLRNGVEKITMILQGNPTGVKRFLYKKDGKVTFAIGDMAASIDDIKEEMIEEIVIEEIATEMAYKPGSFKDTRPQEKGAKAIDALIKSGGMDKKDFQKAKALYVQASDVASRTKLKNFIQDLDTAPLEALMDVIGRNDPNTFQQMYPNAKQGDYLSRIAFQHRKMKSEELDEKADKQTKSYIDDIVGAINRNPKMKLMKPFVKKFKDLAMKTGDVAKSLEDAMPDYIAGKDIARLLNMGEETELDERFSPKEIKMAIGIASDPRYAKGNMTGAVKAIEKMKRGLSDHPQVAAVLKRQNEDLELVYAAANFLGEAKSVVKEKLDKEDEPKVKEIVKKLKGASKAHAGQAADLEKAISEDGHTDVASAIRQCKTIVEDATQMMPKLQSMNPEDALPTWWTNKLAVASNSMNKLRDYFLVPTSESLEDELDEQLDYIVVDKDNKIITRQKNKVDAKEFEKFANSKSYKKPLKKPTKVLPIRSTDKKKIGDTVIGIGMEEVELDEKYDLYHKDFSSAMQHAYDYAKKKMGITVDPKEIDSKVATGPKKPSEGKTNTYRLKGRGGNLQIQVYNKGGSKPFELNMYKEEVELDEVSRAESNKVNAQLSKVLGKINFTHIYNQKGGMFKLPPNVKHEVTVDRNDMKDAAALMMKDKGDIGFMFKQGQIRLVPSMAREVKEWFNKHKCDVKVREIHEGSNVYQAYVPISKTIPNNLRYLTLENQYGMIPEDVENLDDINYKNIKETSITMNGDFWNKLLTAYEEK